MIWVMARNEIFKHIVIIAQQIKIKILGITDL